MIMPAVNSPYSFGGSGGGEADRLAGRAAVREAAMKGDPRPWEAPERFTAELALRDLRSCENDADGTERVVARFVVARIAAWDALVALDPDGARADAHAYVAVLPGGSERRALESVLRASAEGRPWQMAVSLRDAAECARAAGHRGGAFLLFRQAFGAARHALARAEAARSARGIESLAREAGARNVARAWGARARRLERAAADGRAIMDAMAEGYTREHRHALDQAVRKGEALRCPVCGERVVESRVDPRADVAYVRRRIWLLCSGCRRSTSLDVSAGGPP
jgi:hypothetical protein